MKREGERRQSLEQMMMNELVDYRTYSSPLSKFSVYLYERTLAKLGVGMSESVIGAYCVEVDPSC